MRGHFWFGSPAQPQWAPSPSGVERSTESPQGTRCSSEYLPTLQASAELRWRSSRTCRKVGGFSAAVALRTQFHGTGVTEAELLPAAGAGAAFQRKWDDSHGGRQERLGTAAD